MADAPLIDIVKPVCPGWHQHRQLRRWRASLESHAWTSRGEWYLLVADDPDPCKWYIIKEPSFRQPPEGAPLIEYAAEGYRIGLGSVRQKITMSDY